MVFFDVTIKTRLRAEELQQITQIVRDQTTEFTSRSDFIRVAIMKLVSEFKKNKEV
jgi:Arc/MetJ-type ribon-helix-helix transcriptional regulator